MMKWLVAAVGAISAIGTVYAGEAPPLVNVDWIKANSCNQDVRVLDIRSALDGASKADYLRAHIPCSVHSDYKKAKWREEVNDVPGQLPPVANLTKLIGDLGIDNNTHVVVVPLGKDARSMGSATRVYWTFKVLGHDKVSILDGGFTAYAKKDKTGKKFVHKMEKGGVTPGGKNFQATLRKEMIVSKEDVYAMQKKGVTMVDLRPQHQYVGINRHAKAKRNGTIPNALNLPESWLTDNGGGKFRSTDQLKQLYALAKVPTEGEQVSFCNTGHWASLGWFASSELLGNKGVILYDGSMLEWSADNNLPIDAKVVIK